MIPTPPHLGVGEGLATSPHHWRYLGQNKWGIALGKIEVRAENYGRLGIYISCRLLKKWDLWAFGAIAKDQFTDNNIGPGKPSMTSGGWSITNGKSLGWNNSSCWYTPLQFIYVYIYIYFIRYTNRLPQITPNFLGHGYPPGDFLHFRRFSHDHPTSEPGISCP